MIGKNMTQFDIAIVGAGLAGQLAALALARSGRKLALVSPATTHIDHRTTALMDQSIRFVEKLGLWDALKEHSAPLSTMQIIDATDRILRSPTVAFRAGEIGLDAFGWNMPNAKLNEVLSEAIARETNITRFENTVTSIDLSNALPIVTLDNDDVISGKLLVGADGRQSKVREAAKIDLRKWSYPQTALVLNFKHSRPHDNTSTEFHTPTGPFTQVPLPGGRSSLVWVVRPNEAEEMRTLELNELSERLEARMQSMLGKVEIDGPVQSWPLSSMSAHQFGAGRVVLVGEAGHGFPPIGAQGLNLSIRDIIVLTDILGPMSDTVIDAKIGARFDRKRKADVMSRSLSVDLLNRSLLSSFLPVQMLRSAGLHLLSGIAPLRNIVMREGVEPGRGIKAVPKMLLDALRR
jgi:2-octaprenyl-6-methoxyphenol hydroxylase